MNATIRKALIALTAFWFVLFSAYNPFSERAIDSIAIERHVPFAGTGRAYETGPLPAGSVVEQFVTAPEKIEQFDIRFGTYLKRTDARIRISVLPADADTTASECFGGGVYHSSTWAADPWIAVDCRKSPLAAGGKYLVRIETEKGTEDSSPTVFRVRVPDSAAGRIFLDGERISGALQMRIVRRIVSRRRIAMHVAANLALVAGSFVLLLCWHGSVERRFVAFCLCVGWLNAFVTPFPHPIDERTHHFKAESISRGMFFETGDDRGRLGNFLPAGVQEPFSHLDAADRSFLSPVSSAVEFVANPYVANVIPLNHAILAIPLAIGRSLGIPNKPNILMDRLFAYSVYVFLCFLAIRLSGPAKMPIAAAAMIPVTHWLSATISTDPLLCGGSFLFLGTILGRSFGGKRADNPDWLPLLALCAGFLLLSSVKYCGYSVLWFMLFALPSDTAGERRFRNRALVLCGVVFAMSLAAQVVLFDRVHYHEDRNGDTDIARQLSFVVSHPMAFLRAFSGYLVGRLPRANFGEDSGIGKWITAWAFLLAPLSVPAVQPRRRCFAALCLSVALAISFFNVVSLYFAFTPVGADHIDGVQPRYFVPQLPLLFAGLGVIGGCKAGIREIAQRWTLPLLAVFNFLSIFRAVCH